MTINEIARLADVSISTVSKIMNHKDQNITAGTREKVLQIAKEYNYVPYASARSASVSKTFLLGVLNRRFRDVDRLMVFPHGEKKKIHTIYGFQKSCYNKLE